MTAHKVGNFHKGQTLTAVQKQWISRPSDEKFLDLNSLRASVDARRERSIEARFNARKIEFLAPEDVKTVEDTHRLWIGMPDGTEVSPSHWSFGQLATLARAPSGYLRTLPSQIAADALTYGMRYNRGLDEAKFYSADGSLLAATGPEYGRIFDSEVVEAVQQVAGNGIGDARWKVPGVLDWATMTYDPAAPVTADTTTLFASDRDVFMFLVDDTHPIEIGKLPDGSPDLLFRGFYVTNSEVGSSALKLAAFYYRAVCANRLIWGVEGFEELSMRHSKLAPARFIEQARPALNSFAEGSVKRLLEGVEKAKAAKVADDKDEMLTFLGSRGMSRKRALDVFEAVEREEGHEARTIWDVAQGITAVARNVQHTDDRTNLEREAQALLDKVAA